MFALRRDRGTSHPNEERDQMIKTLVRQAARWSMAAKQDTNLMIAVLHANYGVGYFWALRDLATDSDIEQVTGLNVLHFRDQIVQVQDQVTRRLAAQCPNYAPENEYLTQVATTN
jgi:hypothetical protein